MVLIAVFSQLQPQTNHQENVRISGQHSDMLFYSGISAALLLSKRPSVNDIFVDEVLRQQLLRSSDRKNGCFVTSSMKFVLIF